MAKGRWTENEDAFLLRWHMIGMEMIAKHDLARPVSSVKRRFKYLTETGARRCMAEMFVSRADYLVKSGTAKGWAAERCSEEACYWLGEIAAIDTGGK
jgi:hypothetical protein